jgi:hypothetical protein
MEQGRPRAPSHGRASLVPPSKDAVSADRFLQGVTAAHGVSPKASPRNSQVSADGAGRPRAQSHGKDSLAPPAGRLAQLGAKDGAKDADRFLLGVATAHGAHGAVSPPKNSPRLSAPEAGRPRAASHGKASLIPPSKDAVSADRFLQGVAAAHGVSPKASPRNSQVSEGTSRPRAQSHGEDTLVPPAGRLAQLAAQDGAKDADRFLQGVSAAYSPRGTSGAPLDDLQPIRDSAAPLLVVREDADSSD